MTPEQNREVRDAIVAMLDEDAHLRQTVFGCLGIIMEEHPQQVGLECLFVGLALKATVGGAEGVLTLTAYGPNRSAARRVAEATDMAVRRCEVPVLTGHMLLMKVSRVVGRSQEKRMDYVRLRYICTVTE